MMEAEQTILFLSPLHVAVDWLDGESFEYEDVSSSVAEPYIAEINAAIETDLCCDGQPADLMPYWQDCPSSVREKATRLVPRVGMIDNALACICEATVTAALTSKDIDFLKKYLCGQYADGFGEGFEQRGIPIQGGLPSTASGGPDSSISVYVMHAGSWRTIHRRVYHGSTTAERRIDELVRVHLMDRVADPFRDRSARA